MEETTPLGNTDPQNEISQTDAWKSESIDKLAQALSKAQSEMKGAEKKSTNPIKQNLQTVAEKVKKKKARNPVEMMFGR